MQTLIASPSPPNHLPPPHPLPPPPTTVTENFFYTEMIPVGNHGVREGLKIDEKVGLLRARAGLRGMPHERYPASEETIGKRGDCGRISLVKKPGLTQGALLKSLISITCPLPRWEIL